MNEGHLRETLQKLHDELKETDSVDKSTRGQLVEVMGDIHQLLDQSSESSTDHRDLHVQQLKDIIIHMETSHPRLTSTIERVCEMLSSIGI